MAKKLIQNYLLQALFGFAIVTLLGRYAVTQLSIHPGAVVILGTVFSGVFLVLGAGKPSVPLFMKAVSSPYSWAYGFCRIGDTIAYTALLIIMTAAEVEIISKLYIPVAAISSWLLFRKQMSWNRLPGFLLIFAGTYLILDNMTPALQDVLPFLAITVGLLVALSHIVEFHPIGEEANNFRDKMVFIGTVQSVTAVIWVTCTIVVSFAFPSTEQMPSLLRPFIIAAEDVFNLPTLIFSILVISPFRAIAMYGSLNAMRTMGASGYLSGLATLPVLILLGELLLNHLEIMPFRSMGEGLYIALALVVAGGLYNMYAEKAGKRKLQQSPS